jgi:hypothetical protein
MPPSAVCGVPWRSGRSLRAAKSKVLAPCDSDDDHAHLIIGIGGVESGYQFLHHLPGERIHALRAVQGDGQDVVADFVKQGVEMHDVSGYGWVAAAA